VLEAPAHAQARGAQVLAEVRGVGWGGQPARPHGYPRPAQVQPRLLERLLAEATVAPESVAVAYLSGAGDPQQDGAELAILAAMFSTASPLITSVTHLTGEYGGLGAWRVAAATVTLRNGWLPRLDYLCQPIRPDVRFARQCLSQPVRLVLVHGLGRGGLQTAILLGRPEQNRQVSS
jgi:3-oxoacyl-(acyl-carrier-protein) synthase